MPGLICASIDPLRPWRLRTVSETGLISQKRGLMNGLGLQRARLAGVPIGSAPVFWGLIGNGKVNSMSDFSLSDLEQIVAARAMADPEVSWTARLAAAGMPKAAKKLGEEAVETVIAATSQSRGELIGETADLFYHLLVVLRIANVPLNEVMAELERRTAQSGLTEKAERTAE